MMSWVLGGGGNGREGRRATTTTTTTTTARRRDDDYDDDDGGRPAMRWGDKIMCVNGELLHRVGLCVNTTHVKNEQYHRGARAASILSIGKTNEPQQQPASRPPHPHPTHPHPPRARTYAVLIFHPPESR